MVGKAIISAMKKGFFVVEMLCWVHVLSSSHSRLTVSFCRSFLKNLSLPSEVNFTVIPFVVAKDLLTCILDLAPGQSRAVLFALFPVMVVGEPVIRML